jgi:Na+/phosphate symporter
VAAFNKKYEAYNSNLARLNKMLAAYDQENAAYQENVTRYAATCKGQPLYEDEYQRVVDRLGRGM